ncbi:MAG: hypothetical protein Q8M19_28820 [Reyranella sp.]|nr:hypothetical protein [Reyranella sp.]
MTRHKMLAIALGSLAAASLPLSVQAQSGDALVRAEYACSEYGVRPNSAAFNACVNRTARAFDRGDPEIAYRTARTAGEARDVCLSYGLPPTTLGYRQCVANSLENLAAQPYAVRPYTVRPHTVRYVPPDVDTPRVPVIVDEYGRGYDRYGNRLDRNGYVIFTP